ncbi:MAG: hypothetical protein R3181_14680, partial [Rubricoccaceae bacterium]|nr:hypothetical protein [Rubricoccaceae bacterium]
MKCALLVGLLLSWATAAHAQRPDTSGLVLASPEPHPALVSLAPPLHLRVDAAGRARRGAWVYALAGTLVPVGAGIALIAADPTSGDGDAIAGSVLIGGGLLV